MFDPHIITQKNSFQFFIDHDWKESLLAKNIQKKISSDDIHFFHGTEEKQEIINNISASRNSYEIGKKTIVIAPSAGGFFNQCPGTRNLLCCNYYIINPIVGCDFDCHYCFLQGYLDSPHINVVANVSDHLTDLKKWLEARPHSFFRIGTGELGDSLSLDRILGLAPHLISFFSSLPNAQLELKTKSARIDHLLDLPEKGKTIISFSVNPQEIIDQIEIGTASLLERIQAAQKAAEHGYYLAFHFDPLILHENWEKNYNTVINAIFEKINPDKILYISLGVMRYFRNLKQAIERRHPNSPILIGPFVPIVDEKWRYIRPVREEMFLTIKNLIHQKSPDQWIYFCMEGSATWQRVFGLKVSSKRNIDRFFQKRRDYVFSEKKNLLS